MSSCLILFDSDGCTGIEKTSKIDIDARKGGHYEYMYRGKLHLVEVLEISDDVNHLDTFERAWTKTSRASVLSMRKELANGKKGGFLSCLPVSKSMLPVIELHREDAQIKKCTKGTRLKAPSVIVKNIGKKVSKCVKALSSKVSGRKYVCTNTGKDSQRPSVVLTSKKAVNITTEKRKASSSMTSPVNPVKRMKKTALKNTKTTAGRLKHVQPKSRLPASGYKKKVGLKGRVLNVLYEGGMEEGEANATPQRQPYSTEHLTTDQEQNLELQVTQYG
ncbi:uncharacterized protein LOC123545273 [Mercenaria mercenaria]|uniref:uncharacterized protein LOC123545273 n=1 Tax=Mercenaria mercenaria TaxID=6596 RepID=UPI00234FB3FB|nr:uncharacterized protein LOC123545273 [Mercenaria mercenaria]